MAVNIMKINNLEEITENKNNKNIGYYIIAVLLGLIFGFFGLLIIDITRVILSFILKYWIYFVIALIALLLISYKFRKKKG
jgi:uncharacterized membrane protein YeiH